MISQRPGGASVILRICVPVFSTKTAYQAAVGACSAESWMPPVKPVGARPHVGVGKPLPVAELKSVGIALLPMPRPVREIVDELRGRMLRDVFPQQSERDHDADVIEEVTDVKIGMLRMIDNSGGFELVPKLRVIHHSIQIALDDSKTSPNPGSGP